MSYILDALRKAEADRKLGETVGVHDQLAPNTAATPAAERGIQKWLPGVAVGLLLGLVGTLGWMLLSAPSGPAGHDIAPAAPPTPPPDAPQTATPAAPYPGARPGMSPRHDRPGPGSGSDDVVQIPRPAHEERPTSATATQAQPTTAAADTPAANAAIQRVTPDMRNSLPPLSVGGAMYSEVPANRMLVLNGQLYREGDTVAPGMVLERIQLKSAILRYREQRLQLDY